MPEEGLCLVGARFRQRGQRNVTSACANLVMPHSGFVWPIVSAVTGLYAVVGADLLQWCAARLNSPSRRVLHL